MRKDTYNRKVQQIMDAAKNTMPAPLSGILSKAKNQVINTTADIISIPTKLKARKIMKQADSDVKILKLARSYDNAPDKNDDGTFTDAYKARSLARDVKERLSKKK